MKGYTGSEQNFTPFVLYFASTNFLQMKK